VKAVFMDQVENTPNIPRLRKAVDILKKVAEEKRQFNLRSWLSHTREDQPTDEWCGTTACACGYFALNKEFSDLGFKLSVSVRPSTDDDSDHSDYDHMIQIGSIEELNVHAHNTSVSIGSNYIIYDGASGFNAAAKFFNITRLTAEHFFWQDRYSDRDITNPQAVIDRMETYISEHENA
jgi:hypothetical protein